ncbi:MAG: oxygen-independent coproporphyrinogen III oxidase [Acidobacteria bacterium]|nr:oxygen-independent coproporphyrinogen III oxidase [Acidobacteriota bacterium]
MTSTLFAKYDVPVPRYTSYPTVPAWHAAPTAAQWTASLQRALADPSATLSLYVHLPFCESLCTFCGCNTVITRDHGRSSPYIDRVLSELDMYVRMVPSLAERQLSQLHLGGGTPTFASAEELARLVDGILSRLAASGSGRFTGSVEADPRVTSAAQLRALRERRFTRLSLGVQDFNAETQRLVNRIQSPALVASLVTEARAAGYESINFDLIYGLPGQTPASMQRLADEVLRLAPDRLAVYSFARVPWIKPAQRKFTDAQIPVAAEKRALYDVIRRPLLAAGYLELGMDHFARPDDPLARAAAAGTLYRNFQGYTEARTNVLLGLGVSAISESADCYHQNEKVIAVYDRRIDRNEIPTHRGHVLSADDRRRREQIVAVMTRFAVTLDDAQAADAREFLAPMLEDGLAVLEGNELRVPAAGRAFIRNIATFFDEYFRASQPAAPMYSRSI